MDQFHFSLRGQPSEWKISIFTYDIIGERQTNTKALQSMNWADFQSMVVTPKIYVVNSTCSICFINDKLILCLTGLNISNWTLSLCTNNNFFRAFRQRLLAIQYSIIFRTFERIFIPHEMPFIPCNMNYVENVSMTGMAGKE